MSNKKTINKILEAGQGGTLAEVAGKLIDALEFIERMNFVMVTAAGTLEPLADLDFHGKWRIQKAIASLQGISCPEQARLTYEAITSQGGKDESTH